MISFKHVEDYIEFIAGLRDKFGNRLHGHLFASSPVQPISLARYDVLVVQNMAVQFSDNISLSERQAELACKIILKYAKQLASHGISVDSVQEPVFRLQVRKLDYSRRIFIENDQIYIKFPYQPNLIDEIREFAKISQGSCQWNKELKVWQAALTEFNLNWICAWAACKDKKNEFLLDPEVQKLLESILGMEKKAYKICLKLESQDLVIENCPDSLAAYINQYQGGFSRSNMLHLCDMSAVLGYSIDENISQELIQKTGVRFYNLVSNKEIKLNTLSDSYDDELASVFDYADSLKRWPVVIFEPDASGSLLSFLESRYDSKYIGSTSPQSRFTIQDKTRYIHSVKPVIGLERIPLVLTKAAMVFGGTRQTMFQRAEKVVYCTADVYNKNKSRWVKDIAS